jgi:hypothetical protein
MFGLLSSVYGWPNGIVTRIKSNLNCIHNMRDLVKKMTKVAFILLIKVLL